MRNFIAAISVSILSSSLFASPAQLKADYEVLKDYPQNYTVFGTICEEVARLRLEEKFGKDDFEFDLGIAYQGKGRTVGELDVIVFRKSDKEAVVVSEVKCWKNLGKALTKAHNQLNRFRRWERSGNITHMETTDSRIRYNPEQFDENPEFITVSQDGGKEAGFDMELGLDMNEVKTLRRQLMECQSDGQCPSPAKKSKKSK